MVSQRVNESDRLVGDEDSTKLNLDTILTEAIGEFGRYQFKILLLTVVLAIFTAFSSLEYVFSTGRIATRCRIPECEDIASTVFETPWILNAVPAGDQSFEHCLRYQPLHATVRSGSCPADLFDRNVTVGCSDYVYENTNTVVYDFGLACDEWRRSFVGVVHTVGGLLALPLTGAVSDRWGRRAALTANAAHTAWLGTARYWCTHYYVFLVAELAKSTLGGAVFSCAHILVMELVGPKYRVAAGAALNSSIAVGHLLLGAISWAVPNWRHLILTIYLPHFLFISYFWLTSESVRWCMSKKRYKEVENFLRKVSRINKRELPEKSLQGLNKMIEMEETVKVLGKKNEEGEPWLIVLVFQHKEILRRCCISPVWWITSTLIYYGMSINAVNMSGNRHVNLMVVAASEIPGYWFAVLLMDRIGRKPVIIGAYWTCAACQLAYIFIPKNLYLASLFVYLVGKFSIAIVLMSLYIYTAEIYPTQYRHSLVAFSSMIGRIGTIIAPLTPAFGVAIWPHFPSALFCGFAIVAGALVLLAPETLGSKLPDTMEEAARMGVNREKK